MSEIRWTDEQLAAIETSGDNILVAAAAGSGKTAVLIERIIRMLTMRENPADLDELLIMTFTRAAAGQMKEKIYKAIRKAIDADPQNAHLQRQLLKVNSAQIYTIDALCQRIVRENFQDIDIDPGFRIAEEAEIAMLKDDVMKALLEKHYTEPEPGFLEFAESYTDKSDARIEEIISALYRFAVSHPEPEKWIKNSVAPYLANAAEDSIDSWSLEILGEPDETAACAWMPYFRDYVWNTAGMIRRKAERALEISNMNYGPDKYAPVAEDAIEMADKITSPDSCFDHIRNCLIAFTDAWSRFPAVSTKNGEVDPELKEITQGLLNQLRDSARKLLKDFFAADYMQSMVSCGACANTAAAIAALTIEYFRELELAKKERKIAEFNDIAHYALKVLIKTDEKGDLMQDAGGYIYTETADRMAMGLREIIIDEYQDTNQLQECIARALSGERFGRSDIFMVGDVKQSIYGFRMAQPGLFEEKYEAYAAGHGGRRIILDRNFRSRKGVLDLTNYIFRQTMIPEVGGVDYADGNELAYGAASQYGETDEEIHAPEVIFIRGGADTGRKAESYQIALKIEELVGHFPVTDGENVRPAEFSDICILTRTASNPDIEQMLESRGIPFVREASKGFFASLEIGLTLNLLHVIDNPYQDIPFTAVLTSPLCGLDANELAAVKNNSEMQPFSMYEGCREYISSHELPKLEKFLKKIEDYRRRTSYMTVPDLIEYVLSDSGLADIFIAMPQGQLRRANVDLLRSKAVDFSMGSYSGLFNFLRYMRLMEKNDVDFGTASAGAGNAVKMMTIHKSKGLEFPIVILACCGKEYNSRDYTGSIAMDVELGLGIELRDPVEKLITPTLPMETIRIQKKRQMAAEEIRVLYVALTRAKEKLIITGVDQFYGTWTGSAAALLNDECVRLDEDQIVSDRSYLKLIARALIRHKDADMLKGFLEMENGGDNPLYEWPCHFKCFAMDAGGAFEERVVEMLDVIRLDEQLRENLAGMTRVYKKDAPEADADMEEGPAESVQKPEIFDFRYPYEWAVTARAKKTASMLEVRSEDDSRMWKKTARPYGRISDVETSDEETIKLYGAERGTAYHSFFELLDLGIFNDSMAEEAALLSIDQYKNDLVKAGILSIEYARNVDASLVLKLFKSNIGRQMRKAQEEGSLIREQQFVMAIYENGEEVLLQGIIDAFIKRKDGIILIDYKTDRGKSREDFITAYKGQQDAYKAALEAAYGVPVVQELLYLVETGETINLLDNIN